MQILNGFTRGALALSLLLVTAGAQAEKAQTLRLAHNLDRSHVVHQAFEYFAKDVQQASSGKLKVRIYPASQMGNARETLELLQNGALDMAKGSASDLESFDKVYAIYNLPYLFRDQAHFNAVVFGNIGRDIMASTEDKGLMAIAAYVAGTRSFYAKKPITKPEDLKGMKIRVQPSPTTLKMIELMGGSPTPVAFGEVYTAMQQGVVDGAENNVPSWVQTRHIEIAKVFSEDEHTSIPDFLVNASQTWKKFTLEQQHIITEAARKSEVWQQQQWIKLDNESREKARSLGGSFVSVDKAPFRAAVKPLYDEFAQDKDQAELLKRFDQAGR